jgi:hypothetical protein
MIRFNRIKFFFTKPIHVKCSSCELKLKCLGGPKCIHPDKGTSWGMTGYLISVSAIASLLVAGIMFCSDTFTITKNYFLLTWISGSIWTLLFYHVVQWIQRRKRKRILESMVMAQLNAIQHYQSLQQHRLDKIQDHLSHHITRDHS